MRPDAPHTLACCLCSAPTPQPRRLCHPEESMSAGPGQAPSTTEGSGLQAGLGGCPPRPHAAARSGGLATPTNPTPIACHDRGRLGRRHRHRRGLLRGGRLMGAPRWSALTPCQHCCRRRRTRAVGKVRRAGCSGRSRAGSHAGPRQLERPGSRRSCSSKTASSLPDRPSVHGSPRSSAR